MPVIESRSRRLAILAQHNGRWMSCAFFSSATSGRPKRTSRGPADGQRFVTKTGGRQLTDRQPLDWPPPLLLPPSHTHTHTHAHAHTSIPLKLPHRHTSTPFLSAATISGRLIVRWKNRPICHDSPKRCRKKFTKRFILVYIFKSIAVELYCDVARNAQLLPRLARHRFP